MQIDQMENHRREPITYSNSSSSFVSQESESPENSSSLVISSNSTSRNSIGKSKIPRNGRLQRKSPYSLSASNNNNNNVSPEVFPTSQQSSSALLDNIESSFSETVNQYNNIGLYDERCVSSNWESNNGSIRGTIPYEMMYSNSYYSYCNTEDNDESRYKVDGIAAHQVEFNNHSYCHMSEFHDHTTTSHTQPNLTVSNDETDAIYAKSTSNDLPPMCCHQNESVQTSVVFTPKHHRNLLLE